MSTAISSSGSSTPKQASAHIRRQPHAGRDAHRRPQRLRTTQPRLPDCNSTSAHAARAPAPASPAPRLPQPARPTAEDPGARRRASAQSATPTYRATRTSRMWTERGGSTVAVETADVRRAAPHRASRYTHAETSRCTRSSAPHRQAIAQAKHARHWRTAGCRHGASCVAAAQRATTAEHASSAALSTPRACARQPAIGPCPRDLVASALVRAGSHQAPQQWQAPAKRLRRRRGALCCHPDLAAAKQLYSPLGMRRRTRPMENEWSPFYTCEAYIMRS